MNDAERGPSVEGERAAERLTRYLVDECHAWAVEPPTGAQVAAVLHALADHTAIMAALAYRPDESSPWPQATSLGRWFHDLADQITRAKLSRIRASRVADSCDCPTSGFGYRLNLSRALSSACVCGDCYHPAFGPDTDGDPCDWCQDCGCPSADHTRPIPPGSTASHDRRTTVPENTAEKDAGLEGRYRVEKINDPTGKHDDCRYFVLDPQHDVLALQALKFYARLARGAGYVALADDLDEWTRDETERFIAPRPIPPGATATPERGEQ